MPCFEERKKKPKFHVYKCECILLAVHMVPDLWWFYLRFFDITIVWKCHTFSRNCAWNFEFWPFPGLDLCGKVLSHDAG